MATTKKMLVIEKKVALMTKNVGLSRQKRALVLAKKRGPVSKVIDIESERGLREPRRATKNTHRSKASPSRALYAWEE